ncbi:MAG: Histidine triad (HIT) protein [Parcubacteria group bacterium GW2011_GWA1_44_13]|uniref:Histidine triad (HIT) protein n=1 Tax=Candidatus Nomurabacteria bacterium GW2011_GWB1_44_12 TaxID=1618748 RepID=A0A837I9W6_9BACT|nr:MAG: Histidine triad (HIT) protein [Candidatus Nomurabacteria bacterium GW2011_GWB1_44_12]KKT37887.1 MAG: Histidine triad (HIT) protein [Parcubacteria group bacterium GW2011_GWA1_44_13]KKT59970.1 MAG: Histidine triad (HIT) protein [Parcubacteria group bacterium GW2011_GWC1_44_26]HBB44374.1 HIT family protein [Candidatus Yonathbacteria bacterium]
MDCLFCKIIAGEIPCTKVYEDDTVLAFLDIHPVNIGHTLVIPKSHHVNLYDTEDATLAHMMTVTKKLSIAIKKAVGADGINIAMNNESPAEQMIFHTHIQIVPRFLGDGYVCWRGPRDYNEGEADEVAQKIKDSL